MNLQTAQNIGVAWKNRTAVLAACFGIGGFGAIELKAEPKHWVPEGFKLETFARPPEATYPTGMSVSPMGEVYVSLDLNSSLDRKPNRGKIVRCEDTDGDGVADRYTDFVKDLDSPRGSCFVGDTLYVIHPPYLTAFRDTTGDGVADERKELIRGLGFDLTFRGADHTSNGARMGIDGWLYLAIGDYGFTNAVALDGSSYALHGGGVMRVRPDGSELEPYALYTRNICDVAVSPALDVFARDNTNDGKGWDTRLHHFVSLANQGYPRLYKNFSDEHMQPLADYGGGSGTGAYFLDEPGFPADYNNLLYTCDFTTRHVYRHTLERTEATFRAGQDPFYSIQAIDMDVDGFSRMYVNDWEGGGYTYKNPEVGSVVRITYPGLEPAEFPDLAAASDSELLRYLVSKSAVCRLNTQREILKRGRKPVFRDGLRAAAADRTGALYGRVAALFSLKQLYGAESHPVLLELERDPAVREFALRALADRKSELVGVPSEPFARGLSDADPRVRLQALIGLARMGHAEFASKMLELCRETGPGPKPGQYDNNHAIPHTARKALVELSAAEACLEALDAGTLWNEALACLQEMHTPAAVNGLISRLERASDPEARAGILKALFRLYQADKQWDGVQWWTTRPDDRGPYFTPVLWGESDRIRTAVEKHFANMPPALQSELFVEMRRNRMDPGSFRLNAQVDEIQAMIDAQNPGSIAIEPLRDAASSGNRPVAMRVAAFEALGRLESGEAFPAQLQVLDSWKRTDPDNALFARVTRDFVVSSEHLANPKILESLPNRSAGFQRQVLLMICLNLAESPLSDEGTRTITKRLIDRNRRRIEFVRAVGEMGLSEYRKDVVAATESDQHETALAGKEALTRLDELKAQRSTGQSRLVGDSEYAETLVALNKETGSAALGAYLFTRQGCVACHTTLPDQPVKGPYLGDAGKKWKREDLIQSVLKPSEVIAQGFQTQWFEMKDEAVYEGFATGEQDGQIELRNVAGLVFRIASNEVVRRGLRPTSMMPEGLAANLTIHELASLITHLESLK